MKKYITTDEWNIIEDGFHPNELCISESLFGLGNGRFGGRGSFEERYGSYSYRASFVAGISYLDKTRVNWWKNGFPNYYTRTPNAADWSHIGVRLMDEELDLASWSADKFKRRLNMREGIAYRDMEVTSTRGSKLRVEVEHIANMAQPDLCMIRYRVTSLNYSGHLSLVPTIDATRCIKPNAQGEKEWNILRGETHADCAYLWTQTRREDSQVCYALTYHCYKNEQPVSGSPIRIEKDAQVGFSLSTDVQPGDSFCVVKYVTILSSLYHDRQELVEASMWKTTRAKKSGWDKLKREHCQAWQEIWDENDVLIEGDPEAQQGIRFNIFQMRQTYRGDDSRLNISPKGFTGEKYGGNTYWNSELCCVPFFLLSTPRQLSRNLLMYRYNQLKKAIENAEKLGFDKGAALYPQVTSSGEECHSEWETTFEEIHRNNSIVRAILIDGIATGSLDFIANHGLEVIIAICRFWAQRVSYSERRKCYVILGVTGPNEYENNVNNNWFTNFSCKRTFSTAFYLLDRIAAEHPEAYAQCIARTGLTADERQQWQEIAGNIYLPEDTERGIFVENDGFMDKVLKPASSIPADERPINQHWSWDRILRSCFVKQADVVLGLYYYHYCFSHEQVKRNFEFYEPMTVHESSLSPFIHAIVAARIGKVEDAYKLFMHSTRLDLDDYNNETADGLHLTSMAGSWLAIAEGMAGLRLIKDGLSFDPLLPSHWKRCTLNVNFCGRTIHLDMTHQQTTLTLKRGEELEINYKGKKHLLKNGKEYIFR